MSCAVSLASFAAVHVTREAEHTRDALRGALSQKRPAPFGNRQMCRHCTVRSVFFAAVVVAVRPCPPSHPETAFRPRQLMGHVGVGSGLWKALGTC